MEATPWIIEHQTLLRLLGFFGVLALMMGWEQLAPRRRRQARVQQRWSINLGLVFLDSLVVRLLVPVLPVAWAIGVAQREWGWLNNVQLPWLLELIIAIVLLDLVMYLQHVMFHALPSLWRLHLVHHTDIDLDATSGNRFHPLEILISIAIKLAAVTLIGPTAVAVVLFEVILNGMAQFNHANVKLPVKGDRILRLGIVTPDMHRVHHSLKYNETNSNFGNFLPWWDRLFGTYQSEPVAGHEQMQIGVPQFRDPQQLSLSTLLLLPWRRDRGRLTPE